MCGYPKNYVGISLSRFPQDSQEYSVVIILNAKFLIS